VLVKKFKAFAFFDQVMKFSFEMLVYISHKMGVSLVCFFIYGTLWIGIRTITGKRVLYYYYSRI
jgi:hypothetical protein